MRAAAIAVVLAACGPGHDYLTTEELMNPESCMDCHPNHYREWSGSMHAYASDDPVFLAMNARGLADSAIAPEFCVQCHAPMALRLGLTTDGSNLATVPQWAKGVTCFFCHSVDSIAGEHNNPLVLASDDVMRGGLRNPDPVDSPAHRSAYSPLVDADNTASSAMCGACHDIVNGKGVHLERTFEEWQTTIFGQDRPRNHLACGECHMIARTDVAADTDLVDVPQREYGVREHTFAGIDVALTAWPEKAAQLAAIDRDLKGSINPKLCFDPAGRLAYTLDNVGNGHKWPSGAAQDRRAWAEVIVYDAGNTVLYSSGVVADGVDPDGGDPELFRMWDDVFDDNDQPAHLFWEVARHDDATLLKPATTTCPSNPEFYHAREYVYPTLSTVGVARITARVRIRPVPYELMNLLAIDPLIQAELPTHELSGTRVEWTPATEDPLTHCVAPPIGGTITPQCP